MQEICRNIVEIKSDYDCPPVSPGILSADAASSRCLRKWTKERHIQVPYSHVIGWLGRRCGLAGRAWALSGLTLEAEIMLIRCRRERQSNLVEIIILLVPL